MNFTTQYILLATLIKNAVSIHECNFSFKPHFVQKLVIFYNRLEEDKRVKANKIQN